MMHDDITEIADWLRAQIRISKYADVSVVIRVHDGKLSLIEKSIVIKTKPQGAGRESPADKRNSQRK